MKIKFLAIFVLGVLCSFSAYATVEKSSSDSANANKASVESPKQQVVNINSADEKALMTLKGIGKKSAGKIIAYRQANGSFKVVDDLTKVKGISKKVVENNKSRLTV